MHALTSYAHAHRRSSSPAVRQTWARPPTIWNRFAASRLTPLQRPAWRCTPSMWLAGLHHRMSSKHPSPRPTSFSSRAATPCSRSTGGGEPRWWRRCAAQWSVAPPCAAGQPALAAGSMHSIAIAWTQTGTATQCSQGAVPQPIVAPRRRVARRVKLGSGHISVFPPSDFCRGSSARTTTALSRMACCAATTSPRCVITAPAPTLISAASPMGPCAPPVHFPSCCPPLAHAFLADCGAIAWPTVSQSVARQRREASASTTTPPLSSSTAGTACSRCPASLARSPQTDATCLVRACPQCGSRACRRMGESSRRSLWRSAGRSRSFSLQRGARSLRTLGWRQHVRRTRVMTCRSDSLETATEARRGDANGEWAHRPCALWRRKYIDMTTLSSIII